VSESEEILLVEDDEVIAELEKRVLSRAGWRVRAVHRVKDAVALLREQSFRAIVLDYRLPDGEPWIVVTAAKLRIPRVPVIMVTAMGSEGVAAEALQRGVSDYVRKADGFYQELPEVVSRVTKAAAAEESLHLGDRLFQLISGSLSDLILVGNLEGGVSYISPACQYLLGYQAQELKAALDLELVHPEDQSRVVDLLANIRRRRQSSLIFRCRARQGDYRWIESNVNLINDSTTGNSKVIAISRDITERKKAEDEITKLNATLDLALNGAKDYAIFTLNCEGLVASWNSGAERLKGYSAPAIVGRHFSIFYPMDEVRREHPAEILRIAAREGRFEEEGWRVRKDGSRFWANAVITALRDGTGELRGFSKVTRDATELKKAADDLASACRRAEEANRAKSEFLAAMSHEIRTPMNAILGMTDLLKETELDSVQREYTDRCRRAGASLLTLINDILDLSKIESGRFELEQIPFDLEDLVEQTVEMIASRAHLKGVGLFARVDPETPLQLIGDPARLRQILINLLGNAVKFTQSGEIVLNVSALGSGDPARLRFAVTDTGIGIPADKLGAIFEDFTQAESSTTRRFGGTGLGLGIARRLVNCMGGDLTVSSVLGQGSTFAFDAIFAINQHPLPAELPQGAQDLAGRHVLIVDDNTTNRLILSRMCSGWGMLPSEAGSAADASRLVEEALREQRPYALAILDVLMPDVGGFETLTQIRALSPGVPIIMSTSNNQPGDATKARALGASAFTVKPIRRAELLRLVLAAIRPDHPAVTQPPAGTPKTNAGAAGKILVAEDSEDNRFLVEVYLGSEGYDLTFVENGQDALDAFEKETFDLVLMDIQMPVMDGLEATELMRALERRNTRTRTPILALTADALLGDAERSHSAGCDGHLAKPISKEDLITAIENFRFVAQAI
jgi:PAS domain S-box-containing protein